MTRAEYLKSLFEAWRAGKISDEAYDAGLLNIDAFSEDEEE